MSQTSTTSLFVPAVAEAFPNICPPHNHFDNSTACPTCQHDAEVDVQLILEEALNSSLIDEATFSSYANLTSNSPEISSLRDRLITGSSEKFSPNGW